MIIILLGRGIDGNVASLSVIDRTIRNQRKPVMRAILNIAAPLLSRGMTVTLIKGQELSIGSSRWADVVVPDIEISRMHVQFSMSANECWLRDLKSSSGTYVNGIRVIATELHDGDRVQLGETIVTVSLPDVVRSMVTSEFEFPGFRIPQELRAVCSFEALHDGVYKISGSRQSLRKIAVNCLDYGLGILTHGQMSPAVRSRPVTTSAIKLKWLTVTEGTLDQCLSELWDSESNVWIVGHAPANLPQLLSHFSDSLRSQIREQVAQPVTEQLSEFFDRFFAVLLNDEKSGNGWSLIFRRKDTSMPNNSVEIDARSSNRGCLSSVAYRLPKNLTRITRTIGTRFAP